MRQRVAFLRTLLAGRPVLCLDEPFGALDALTRVQMQQWLAGALQREPRTVLLVTHDVEEAALLADRIVLLSARPGRVVATLEVPLPRPRQRTDLAGRRAARAGARGARGGRARGRAHAAGRAGLSPMPAAALVLAALAAWEAIVRLGVVDQLLLPAPTQVLDALWTDRALLGEDLAVTLSEVLLGLAVAIAVGAALAIGMHLSSLMRKTLRPLVIGSQAVPVPVIAPLFILVLGFGLVPKVLMVALVCFFPVTINLYDGLRDVDPDARKLLRSLDATRWQAFRLLEAPSALPATFTGIKIAAAVAVIGAVFAEWAGADQGLGHALLTANGQLETARAFAATLLLFLLAVALYGAFAALERRVVDWTPRSEPAGGP